MATTKGKGKTAVTPKPTDPAAVKFTIVDVPLGDLDPATAAGVRADANERVVAEYAERDRDDPEDIRRNPVEVCRGPTKLYLWDGRHRLLALERNGRPTIPARVRVFKTDAGAHVAAIELSAGANADHGLGRSDADKYKAVEQYLGLAYFAAKPDREAGLACRVSAPIVRSVRADLTSRGTLTGKASAERYGEQWDAAAKRWAVGYNHRGKVLVPAVPSAAAALPPADDQAAGRDFRAKAADADQSVPPEKGREGVRADAPTGELPQSGNQPEPAAAAPSEPEPAPVAAEPVIPDRLQPLFACGPALRELRQACGRLEPLLKAAAGHLPELAGLRAELGELAVWAARFVAEGVCPRCDGAGCAGCHGRGFVPLGEVGQGDGAAATAERIGRLSRSLNRINAQVKEVAATPFGRHIIVENVTHDLEAASKSLLMSRPTEPCPYCLPDDLRSVCKACFGSGVTTQSRRIDKRFRNAPQPPASAAESAPTQTPTPEPPAISPGADDPGDEAYTEYASRPPVLGDRDDADDRSWAA